MFHYRKKRELEGLSIRLQYELPSPPTDDQIALVASTLKELHKRYDEEYMDRFGMSRYFHRKGRKQLKSVVPLRLICRTTLSRV